MGNRIIFRYPKKQPNSGFIVKNKINFFRRRFYGDYDGQYERSFREAFWCWWHWDVMGFIAGKYWLKDEIHYCPFGIKYLDFKYD